ncbi:MAG: hypothetical protein HUJ57_06715 [Erysipelotrichaceae bacterium]|nr:hypothetical protein [Erysipelotrichaceae bacterium]
MKKLLIALLAMACVWTVGCAKKEEAPAETQEETTEVANPMKEATVEDINNLVGIEIKMPEGAEVTAAYIISDKVGEVRFTLDGKDYTYRAAKGDEEDISGLYYDWKQNDDIHVNGHLGKLMGAEGIANANWYDAENKINYSLNSETAGTELIMEVAPQL